ncbi:MAG: hypothetical protein AB7L84_12065 [Acidimicrobiia bacterium]
MHAFDVIQQPRRTRVPLLVAVAVLAVLAGGCRLDVRLDVAVRADGSGVVELTVSLDADATARLGPDPGQALALEDLAAAGWEVRGPTTRPDGTTQVRASKAFADPAGLTAVVEEIAGPAGPFQGLSLQVERSFGRTTWELAGRLDPAVPVESFGDEGLAAELDGKPIGRDLAALEAEVGRPLGEAVGFAVAVTLPGSMTAEGGILAGDEVTWSASYGAPPVDLAASGTERRVEALAWSGAAVACGVLLVVVLVVRAGRALWRWRRGRRPGHAAG